MEISELKGLTTVQISLKYRNYSEIKSLIDLYTSFLPETVERLQRIYHFKYDIREVPKCPYCKNDIKFTRTVYYHATCGDKVCWNLEKSKNINIAFASTDSKEKSKNIVDEKKKICGYDNTILNIVAFVENMSIDKMLITDTSMLCKVYKRSEKVRTLIDEQTSVLPIGSNIAQRIYIFKTNEPIPLCNCGKFKKYKNNGKYRESCGSKECANLHREDTCVNIYGESNVSKVNIFKEKIIKTSTERYGAPNPMQSDIIKTKQKYAIIKKYGVDNISKLESIKKKKTETCMNNFGSLHPMQSSEVKIKSKETCFLKYDNYWIQSKQYLDIKRIESLNKSILISAEVCSINEDFSLNCKCSKDHNYTLTRHLLYWRERSKNIICTECNPIGSCYSSGGQNEIYEYISSIYNGNIIVNNRSIFNGKYELDLYLPELNIAFEFNGIYWHSELFKDKNYHLIKTMKCQEKNIQLIHIWEDDWKSKQDIVKSVISSKLRCIKNKIFGRKTVIRDVSTKDSKKFLEQNHLQGFCISSIRIGLFFDEELVSLMTLGKSRVGSGKSRDNGSAEKLELLRFCSKINNTVVGGASKLFNHFKQNHVESVYSYSDISRNTGRVYEELGFTKVYSTQPNYYYVVDHARRHRFNFRKDVLIMEGYDPKKTEHEIMLDRGIYRIYDCGSAKFEWTRPEIVL